MINIYVVCQEKKKKKKKSLKGDGSQGELFVNL
jgi:hypothetical protein